MQIQPQIYSNQQQARFANGRLARLPWDIQLARNPQLSRLFIDALGSVPWQILIVRNQFERLEHVLSLVNYLSFCTIFPVLLGKILNNIVSPQLKKQFKLTPSGSSLSIPFALLEPQMVKKIRTKVLKADLAKYGLRSISQLTPKLANKIANFKIAIILVDLLLITTKGQSYNWLKNWMTEKLSGRVGYSGIFNEANEAYVKQKSDRYNHEKKKRLKLSLAIGYGSAVLLPLAVAMIFKSCSSLGKGILGKAKQFLPWFDYTNVVYLM